MKKNVLVLTGSPRKDGNTDLMADAFVEAAEANGHSVTKIRTADFNMQGCTACDGCYANDRPCCCDDNFNQIAPLIEAADVIAIAAPLYFYSFPTQLKAVLDHCYSFIVGERPVQGKECVLMTCGEDTSERSFDGIFRSYELITNYMEWTDLGKLYVTGVNKAGEIRDTDGLERAARLGASI